MPIYEYQCQHCGEVTEKLQKHSDAPLTDCPNCQKAELKKIISGTSFQLKGTGWYVTDFRDKNKPETKAKDQKKDTKQAKKASSGKKE